MLIIHLIPEHLNSKIMLQNSTAVFQADFWKQIFENFCTWNIKYKRSVRKRLSKKMLLFFLNCSPKIDVSTSWYLNSILFKKFPLYVNCLWKFRLVIMRSLQKIMLKYVSFIWKSVLLDLWTINYGLKLFEY